MNRNTWKTIERRWAGILGGQRVPTSGRCTPDVMHDQWAVEVKSGAVLSTRLQKALRQAQRAAKGTDKIPLVCIEHCRQGAAGNLRVVMLSADDFLELATGRNKP